MSDKPVLLITRKLPDAVEARAMRDYDAILNTSDEQLSAADLIERSKGVDAILTCSTELFSAEVIEGLAPSVKAVATFSVGYEHIDTAAAKKRGPYRNQHARCPHRCNSRPHYSAYVGGNTPCFRMG